MANNGAIYSTIILSAAVGAFVTLLFQNRTRSIERQTYGSAVAREILFLVRKLNEFETDLEKYISESNPTASIPALTINDKDMQIYDSNTSKIGLLDGSIAFRTIKFYREMRGILAEYPQYKDISQHITGRRVGHGVIEALHELEKPHPVDPLYKKVKEWTNYGDRLCADIEWTTMSAFTLRYLKTLPKRLIYWLGKRPILHTAAKWILDKYPVLWAKLTSKAPAKTAARSAETPSKADPDS